MLLIAGVLAALGVDTDDADGETSPLSTIAGFVYLVIMATYDPVATKLFGGSTPGRRVTKQQVVSWEDGSPVSLLTLWARNVLLLLEWGCVVPGIVDLALTSSRPDGRSWVDRATGTAIVDRREAIAPTWVESPPPTFRPEPWGSLIAAAHEARARFGRTVAPIPPGPLRERLDEADVRVAACEAECIRVADRGAQLAQATAGHDLAALRARHAEAAADPAKASLADAYSRELASAERLATLVGTTTDRLLQLVAELNSAVNTGIEIALSPTDAKTFDLLLDQLDGLRASLHAVEIEAGPTAI